ncbi:MAG: dephospho-CoA kinase [Treponema sp.]|jgi:dephospho-CoA kinase|nr:dephospho-CoA kinase [Treponema sp.]
MLIGLTGKYCAGKNHAADILEKRGLPVLDVDKLGHAALEHKKEEVFARFGQDLKNPDGSVNRRLLGEKVFRKKDEITALEAIVHPQTDRMTLEWISSQNGKTCVINAALLHRLAVFGRFDCIFLVDAPFLVRLFRAKRRDRLPWVSIFRRLMSQKRFTLQYLAGNADIYIVENPWTGGFLPGSAGKKTKMERRIGDILSKLELENRKIQGGF